VDSFLRDAYAKAQRDNDRPRQLRVSVALASFDAGQVDYLYGRLLEAEGQEVVVIRGALAPYQAELREHLSGVLQDRQPDLARRCRAACALADYAPEDPRWEKVSADVVARLVSRNAFELGHWAKALRPVGKNLLPALATYLEDEKRSGAE